MNEHWCRKNDLRVTLFVRGVNGHLQARVGELCQCEAERLLATWPLVPGEVAGIHEAVPGEKLPERLTY